MRFLVAYLFDAAENDLPEHLVDFDELAMNKVCATTCTNASAMLQHKYLPATIGADTADIGPTFARI